MCALQTAEQALEKLKKSKFRAVFRLSAAVKEYVRQKGMDTIRRHAEDFIASRLSTPAPVAAGDA